MGNPYRGLRTYTVLAFSPSPLAVEFLQIRPYSWVPSAVRCYRIQLGVFCAPSITKISIWNKQYSPRTKIEEYSDCGRTTLTKVADHVLHRLTDYISVNNLKLLVVHLPKSCKDSLFNRFYPKIFAATYLRKTYYPSYFRWWVPKIHPKLPYLFFESNLEEILVFFFKRFPFAKTKKKKIANN